MGPGLTAPAGESPRPTAYSLYYLLPVFPLFPVFAYFLYFLVPFISRPCQDKIVKITFEIILPYFSDPCIPLRRCDSLCVVSSERPCCPDYRWPFVCWSEPPGAQGALPGVEAPARRAGGRAAGGGGPGPSPPPASRQACPGACVTDALAWSPTPSSCCSFPFLWDGDGDGVEEEHNSCVEVTLSPPPF